jgi:beta-1,2-mannosidase
MPTTRRDLFKLGGAAATAAALTRGAAAPAASAAPGTSAAASLSTLPVGYPMGPFVRDPANPILRPSNRPWESRFVFNPAAVVKDGLVQLLYRAQGPDGRSSIGLATSSDGVHFERQNKPVMEASEPLELPGGCEDPRVIEVGGTSYMTYTGYDGTSARLCLPLRGLSFGALDQARAAVPELPDAWRRQAVEQVRRDPLEAAGRPLHHVLR